MTKSVLAESITLMSQDWYWPVFAEPSETTYGFGMDRVCSVGG
jgi:hypothetical protein